MATAMVKGERGSEGIQQQWLQHGRSSDHKSCIIKMRVLNLCSGTGSVSKPFLRAGHECVDVDWDGRYAPTHCVDIMTWECPYKPGDFDVIWASPDCTQYSRARTTALTPRNLVRADALVKRCLDLIFWLQPRLWFLENPDSGLLKTRDVVEGLPFVRVDYCMYGTMYRKRTRIWTNAVWTPKMCDRSHLIDNKHAKTAQRGGRGGWDREDRFSRDELHALPADLCDEIYAITHSQ